MSDKFQYRLSNSQKQEIAQNLIDILKKDLVITKQASTFIGNWIYDVWDIVLKNYLPTIRPILFRACERITKGEKIVSFTGRLECARRFSNGSGSLIICDTKAMLEFEKEFIDLVNMNIHFIPLLLFYKKRKKAVVGDFLKVC